MTNVIVFDDFGNPRVLWPEEDPGPERDAEDAHHLARLAAMGNCATLGALYAHAAEHCNEKALEHLSFVREAREAGKVHKQQEERLLAMSVVWKFKAEVYWRTSSRWLLAAKLALRAEYESVPELF